MTIAKLAACAIAIATATGAGAAAARAQTAEADVLFREGKKLLKAGNIAEACDKLDASERLESSVGTLLNLGDCREKNHQLATAWAIFRKAVVAAKKARDGKRELEARRREKLLGPRLSYLEVHVPDSSRVDGLAITRNGVELDRALWKQSVPIDAGDYELVASAEGYAPWTEHVRIDREGQRVEIEVPALAAKQKSIAAKPPTVQAAAVAAPATARERTNGEAVRRDRPTPSSLTRTRGVAIALAAVGAAGVAVGVTYGLRGRDLEQQSDARCPTSTCNDPAALSLNSDARRDGRIANISFAAGGSLLATAIVLWLVGGPRIAPVVARDRVGIALAIALAGCSFPTKHPGMEDAGSADAETPFGCQGLPFGTTAPAQIMISGQALDLGTGVAATGTSVTGMLDSGTSVFTRTVDASGSFSAIVDTAGHALAGYVVTTAGTYVPSYFFPSHPFDRDTEAPLPMLTAMELTQIGNPADTALAELILGDCLGTGLEGCTLAITPAAQRIEYSKNGTPDPTATATDATGYVLVYGLPPGTALFMASCPSGALRASSLAIAMSSTYFIRLEP